MTADELLKIAIEKTIITKKATVKLLNIVKYGELTCELCGYPINDGFYNSHCDESLTIDHIIPIARGGLDWIENMQIAHKVCNNRKDDK